MRNFHPFLFRPFFGSRARVIGKNRQGHLRPKTRRCKGEVAVALLRGAPGRGHLPKGDQTPRGRSGFEKPVHPKSVLGNVPKCAINCANSHWKPHRNAHTIYPRLQIAPPNPCTSTLLPCQLGPCSIRTQTPPSIAVQKQPSVKSHRVLCRKRRWEGCSCMKCPVRFRHQRHVLHNSQL